MGRGRKNKCSNLAAGSQLRGCMTLRDESTGKKHGNVNAKTMCKIDHLKDLALWATEASIPSFGAFFGERLAPTSEALGLRNDPLHFLCERCESILQPGSNCSVRIEKSKSKGRHRQKRSNSTPQNNVVYRCHFCSHQNLMRGTPKGYIKEICPQKPKPTSNVNKARENHPDSRKATTTTDASLPINGQSLEANSPATPLPITSLSLLDSKRRKRNRSAAKKVVEPQTRSAAADLGKSIKASSKRRKKSWTSLKEIAESSNQDVGKKLKDLTLPFFI